MRASLQPRAYRARYGVQTGEEFRRPGVTPSTVAWGAFHQWEVSISAKLDRVRSTAGPKGDAVLIREVQSPTRDWRSWVINGRRERPAPSAAWAAFLAPLAKAQAGMDTSDADDDATTRHRIKAEVATLGCLSEFLADAKIAVLGLGFDRFVDAVEEQFGTMHRACSRREQASDHVAGAVTDAPLSAPRV